MELATEIWPQCDDETLKTQCQLRACVYTREFVYMCVCVQACVCLYARLSVFKHVDEPPVLVCTRASECVFWVSRVYSKPPCNFTFCGVCSHTLPPDAVISAPVCIITETNVEEGGW